jgi:hypothetical protein
LEVQLLLKMPTAAWWMDTFAPLANQDYTSLMAQRYLQTQE